MTATRSLPEAPLVAQVTPGLLPRPSDGTVNLRGPLRQLAEPIASETMGAGADQTRAGGNSGSGHRERRPATCVGTPAPRVPRPGGGGSFFPKDAPVRHQGVDRAPVATAAETCATGTSTRKARGIASKMGTGHLPEDWAGATHAEARLRHRRGLGRSGGNGMGTHAPPESNRREKRAIDLCPYK